MKSNKYQSLIKLKQGKPIMININGKYIPILYYIIFYLFYVGNMSACIDFYSFNILFPKNLSTSVPFK